MAESASKKENKKKKALKKKEKLSKREDRKVNNNKGKSLEELLMYVDINGVLTTTPPHLQDQEIRKREVMEAQEFVGTINYQSDKGYGFISEENSTNSINIPEEFIWWKIKIAEN